MITPINFWASKNRLFSCLYGLNPLTEQSGTLKEYRVASESMICIKNLRSCRFSNFLNYKYRKLNKERSK